MRAKPIATSLLALASLAAACGGALADVDNPGQGLDAPAEYAQPQPRVNRHEGVPLPDGGFLGVSSDPRILQEQGFVRNDQYYGPRGFIP